ncbi:hypothetical protein D3C85_946620 [compost metagenome]
MQAIPGFAFGAVHRDQEQVVPLQARQQRIGFGNRLRVTTEGGAQRSTKAVAHGHEQHQVEIGRRQVGQHLDFKKLGERLIVPHLNLY